VAVGVQFRETSLKACKPRLAVGNAVQNLNASGVRAARSSGVEIFPALDRPKTKIAEVLGLSRQTLYDSLEEKQPMTPVTALRLGKLCGNGPDLRLNLQKRYDLHQAQQQLGEKIRKIPTLAVV
jgi:addiction module HigA family antidote